MEARPQVRFMTVGEEFGHLLAAHFGEDRSVALPFTELDTYPAAMTNFDIALAPSGRTNFYRAKSDLRWLEASALGIPTVADPTLYDEIEDGVTGVHAAEPDEVEAALLRLVDDADARRRIGDAARADVVERRSMAAMAPQWTAALSAAATARAKAA
jgi:glycosyltransferase involved in cell wall biosynthesis